MTTIYIFQTGEWDRRTIKMVSSDVKLISNLYASKTNKKDYISAYDSPNVDIWENNEYIGCFHEFEKNEGKIIKALSKRAMKIN